MLAKAWEAVKSKRMELAPDELLPMILAVHDWKHKDKYVCTEKRKA